MYKTYLSPPLGSEFGNENILNAQEIFLNGIYKKNNKNNSRSNIPINSIVQGTAQRGINNPFSNNQNNSSPYSVNNKQTADESLSYVSTRDSSLPNKNQQQYQATTGKADIVKESAFSKPLSSSFSSKKNLNMKNCNDFSSKSTNSNTIGDFQQLQHQELQNQNPHSKHLIQDVISRFKEPVGSNLGDNYNTQQFNQQIQYKPNGMGFRESRNNRKSPLAQQIELFKQFHSKQQQQQVSLIPSRGNSPLNSSTVPLKQFQMQTREPLKPVNSNLNIQSQLNQHQETNEKIFKNNLDLQPFSIKNNNTHKYSSRESQYQQQKQLISSSSSSQALNRNCSPLSQLLQPLSICFNNNKHNSRELTPTHTSNNQTAVTRDTKTLNHSNITKINIPSSVSLSHKNQLSLNQFQSNPSNNASYFKYQCLTPPNIKKKLEFNTLTPTTQVNCFSNVYLNPSQNTSSSIKKPNNENISVHTPSKDQNEIQSNNFTKNNTTSKKSLIIIPYFNYQTNDVNQYNNSGNYFTELSRNNYKSRSASPLIKYDESSNNQNISNIFNFQNDKDQSYFNNQKTHHYDCSTLHSNIITNNNNNFNDFSKEISAFQTPLKSPYNSTQNFQQPQKQQLRINCLQNHLVSTADPIESPRFHEQVKDTQYCLNNTNIFKNIQTNNGITTPQQSKIVDLLTNSDSCSCVSDECEANKIPVSLRVQHSPINKISNPLYYHHHLTPNKDASQNITPFNNIVSEIKRNHSQLQFNQQLENHQILKNKYLQDRHPQSNSINEKFNQQGTQADSTCQVYAQEIQQTLIKPMNTCNTSNNHNTIPNVSPASVKQNQFLIAKQPQPAAIFPTNYISERSPLKQIQQQPHQSQPKQQQQLKVIVRQQLNPGQPNPTTNKKEPLPVELTKQLERFTLGKILGYGSYAVVRVVEDNTTNLKYALKTYEKKKLADPQKRKNVTREVKILSKLKNPNIVRLYDVIESSSQLHLLMEYPTSTELSVHIRQQINRRLMEEDAKVMFSQLVQAVMYCHRKSVIHRDIKLENVLYEPSTSTVKLIDFGFAIALAPGAKLNIFCGTPSYMAPEIVNKKDYTFPVDTWALGVLLFKTLNGVFPFRGADDKELFRKINACKLEFQPFVSQPARNLLGKILKVNPIDRLTPEQVNKNNESLKQFKWTIVI